MFDSTLVRQSYNEWEPSNAEHKDNKEPEISESESSSDSDKEPRLSNVDMHTKKVILLYIFSFGWNNFVYLRIFY